MRPGRSSGLLLLAATLLPTPRVTVDARHYVHVAAGKQSVVIAPLTGEIGIANVQVSSDHKAVGWTAMFPNPDGGSPIAASLVVWIVGGPVHTMPVAQTIWSWAFDQGSAHVAFHAGPVHGETAAHCQLRDLATGRRLAAWTGDLASPARPAWTHSLNH